MKLALLFVEEEHNSNLLLIRYDPFTLLRDQAERHIKGTNLLAMSMANRLPADDLEEVKIHCKKGPNIISKGHGDTKPC
jgi:hypothetical protein